MAQAGIIPKFIFFVFPLENILKIKLQNMWGIYLDGKLLNTGTKEYMDYLKETWDDENLIIKETKRNVESGTKK